MHTKILAIMTINDDRWYRCILQEKIPILIPEIKATYRCDGGPHHAETVFAHLVETSSHISPRFPLLRFAAFLHDIGKPATYKDGIFRNHAKVGAEIAEKIMKRLGCFSEKERLFVTSLIQAHMMPPFGRMRQSRIASKFLELKKCGVSLEDFIRLRLADRNGNRQFRMTHGDAFSSSYPRFMLQTAKGAIRKMEEQAKSHNPLAVTGRDVMDILGIPEGPEVGRVLREIAEKCAIDDREALLSAIEAYRESPALRM